MPHLFPPSIVALPVVGTADTFPARRVYCVGRNYAAHAREFGNDEREPPFFFLKPTDALQPVPIGALTDHPYPQGTSNYHYEIELVAALGRGGRDIAPERALEHVYGYAVGLDMTRRDLQRQFADQKKPWTLGKCADHSAPIGPIHPAAVVGHPADGFIRLAVDGEIRQDARLSAMTWSVAEQIAHLSGFFELFPGDLIFSGTPEGVGPVVRGAILEGAVEGLGALRLKVV